MAARWAHNAKVGGSNPSPATTPPVGQRAGGLGQDIEQEPPRVTRNRHPGQFIMCVLSQAAGTLADGRGGSGGRIRTSDLWVMSPTSCHCSTPRHKRRRPSWSCWSDVPAAASPPTESPLQYSPALPRVTTGFGMGPGGATALSATGTSDQPVHVGSTLCWCVGSGCQYIAIDA